MKWLIYIANSLIYQVSQQFVHECVNFILHFQNWYSATHHVFFNSFPGLSYFRTWNASFKLKELQVIRHKGACRMRAHQANHWFQQHPGKKISQYLKGCMEEEFKWHLIDCKILLANYFPLLSIRKENLTWDQELQRLVSPVHTRAKRSLCSPSLSLGGRLLSLMAGSRSSSIADEYCTR